ncbi:hypothetical protein AB205_0046790 [Aquarana catesbeiana]|uniref:Uncharacterized protein n=1 Tax=Aquarana catesbeiana TaxID=8400 RepID=A0A2G9S8N5_AQUCT|nr:hypothetical protein AB205_0046790 [Aquarana catesbeiana]
MMVKYGPYSNPNVRKAKIMTKVVRSHQKNFGVRRSKEQLRKIWSDLKLREQDQYRRIKRVLQKSTPVHTRGLSICETLITKKGRKDSGHLRTPRTPIPRRCGGGGSGIGRNSDHNRSVSETTASGDVDVVEEETHFTSARAQILIGEITVCNQELEKVMENINDVEKRLNNIIDVLGRI